MKKIFAITLAVFVPKLYAQNCCQVPAVSLFTTFAQDESFLMVHNEPLPYRHCSDIGKEITFRASDGKEAYAYELKAIRRSDRYLLVFHEWWGLNDHIKREAEKLYNDLQGKVNVIALDLYDKKVANTRQEASQYMQTAKKERIESIIQGIFEYAGRKAKFATIGWCFGGGWSLQASIMAERRAVACIVYYGMPEKNLEKLKKLKAELLGIFAKREQWISPSVVAEFEKNLQTLQKKYTIQSFDAEHAFANPSNPHYDVEAAQKAYQLSIDFLKRKLL